MGFEPLSQSQTVSPFVSSTPERMVKHAVDIFFFFFLLLCASSQTAFREAVNDFRVLSSGSWR